jgi:hypothetical protein
MMPIVLFSILFSNGRKSYTEGQVVPRGRPKYVKGILPIRKPNTEASTSIFSDSTFIGMILDFE